MYRNQLITVDLAAIATMSIDADLQVAAPEGFLYRLKAVSRACASRTLACRSRRARGCRSVAEHGAGRLVMIAVLAFCGPVIAGLVFVVRCCALGRMPRRSHPVPVALVGECSMPLA